MEYNISKQTKKQQKIVPEQITQLTNNNTDEIVIPQKKIISRTFIKIVNYASASKPDPIKPDEPVKPIITFEFVKIERRGRKRLTPEQIEQRALAKSQTPKKGRGRPAITKEELITRNEAKEVKIKQKCGRKKLTEEVIQARELESKLKVKNKVGRKPLTDNERVERKQYQKSYQKNYYIDHPEKYKQLIKQYGGDYSNACIYKLFSPKTKKFYIASTTMDLDEKLKNIISKLKKPAQNNRVFKLMKFLGGVEWQIAPLIKIPLKDVIEMRNLEQIYISSHQNEIININRRYCMEAIHDLLVSFPAHLLPIKCQRYMKLHNLTKV